MFMAQHMFLSEVTGKCIESYINIATFIVRLLQTSSKYMVHYKKRPKFLVWTY